MMSDHTTCSISVRPVGIQKSFARAIRYYQQNNCFLKAMAPDTPVDLEI